MTEYCTATDVSNRLKAAGYLNVIDDDQDGSADAAEIAAYITPSIARAGKKIDYYLINRNPPYTPSSLRGTNDWCKDRCVDIAVYYAATNGGRDCPDSFQSAYDDAIEELKAIMEDANVIPDTTIDTPYNKDDHTPFEILSGATT